MQYERIIEQAVRDVQDLLWGIMNERDLNRLLGVRQKFRMMSWRKKPPAR